MKRLILVFISIILVVLLTGCSIPNDKQTTSEPESTEINNSPTVTDDTIVNGVTITVYFIYENGPRERGLDVSETITKIVKNGEEYRIELPHKDGYVMHWEKAYYVEGQEDDYVITGVADSKKYYNVFYRYIKDDLITLRFYKQYSDNRVEYVESAYVQIVDNKITYTLPQYEGFVLGEKASLKGDHYSIENGVLTISDIYVDFYGEKIWGVPNIQIIVYCESAD